MLSLNDLKYNECCSHAQVQEKYDEEEAPWEFAWAPDCDEWYEIEPCQSVCDVANNVGNCIIALLVGVFVLGGPVGKYYLEAQLEHPQKYVKGLTFRFIDVGLHLLLQFEL